MPSSGDDGDLHSFPTRRSSDLLHVGSLSGVTVTGNDSGTLTVSGLGSGVNTVLAGLTYTANSEFKSEEQPPELQTQTNLVCGPLPEKEDQTVGITVNPVSDTPA